MSLWPRDECRIVLRPHQVVLARVSRDFTGSGWRKLVRERKVVSCKGTGVPWSSALKALEAALPEMADGCSSATVILSNHFVRYALIPWSDTLDGEKEELAYAQHIFKEMYGGDPGEWELRVSAGTGTQVASAVDTALLVALRELFIRFELDLVAIQPHLMLAYNACLDDLRHRSTWLALIENGSLCLALLLRGQWSWIRMMRIGPHWHRELPFLLSREALVANTEDNVDDVLLWAPDHTETAVDPDGRWKIRQLQPAAMPAFSPELGNRFAMYMSE